MKDITREVESIYSDFGNTLVQVPKDFTILSDKGGIVGYCTKYSDIYKVVYPITGNSKVDDKVKMHEYGHIYCGHLEGIHEQLDSNLAKIIRNKDSQLIDLVNNSCNIDYAEDILDMVISNPILNHAIHNIAMDMEVNSVILNDDDLNELSSELSNMMYEEYMRISENGTKMPSNRQLNNLSAKFNIKSISPSEFGFTPGLTYPDYLVQLILHLDLVIKMLSNQYNNDNNFKDSIDKNRQKGEKGNSQSQQGSGESDESEDGKDSNEFVPKTREEFEEMMNNSKSSGSSSNDESESDSTSGSLGSKSDDKNNSDSDNSNGNGKNEDNGKDDDSQSQQGSGESDESEDESNDDHGYDSRNEADEKRKTDLGNYANPGGSGRGLNRSTAVRDYVIDNDPLTMALEEIIKEFRHKVIKRDFTKDMTHKYNRRILGSNNKMLSPTYRQKITKSEKPTVAFYIDVSGSMDGNLVNRIITTIRNKMKRIDMSLLYNIITWDTRLCEFHKDINFDSPIPHISSGGGTELEGCFDHFQYNFGKDAIMIIISDFGDQLDNWHEKESKMNGYLMYGLKYGNDTWYNGGVQPNWKNFKVRQCD